MDEHAQNAKGPANGRANDGAGPLQVLDATKARFAISYAVRRAFKGDIQFPPEVPGVDGAIDIH